MISVTVIVVHGNIAMNVYLWDHLYDALKEEIFKVAWHCVDYTMHTRA